ncbi:MAG: FkbM family methyltransferase, partial [Armatimonadota bacterium]
MVDVLGIKMYLNPAETVDGNLWFAPHLYDRKELSYLFKRFPSNGVLVDVGAYIGFWSILFARHFPQSTVIAIEANPTTFQRLIENIKLNHLTNIRAVNVGAADKEGVLPLSIGYHCNLGSASFVLHHREGYTLDVQVKPLMDSL